MPQKGFQSSCCLCETAEGVDFSVNNTLLIFTAPGQQCLSISIANDSLLEGTEQLLGVLSSLDYAMKISVSSFRVLIKDDTS